MANDWKEYKIDDLKASVKGSIAMGPFGSRIKAENFVSAGVPIIKGAQLHGAYLSDSGFDFLTPEKAEELKSSQAYRGDLVITHRGTIGQVSIIPHDSLYEKYIVSQSQLKVSLDTNKINPYFVNYFFKTYLGQYRLLANASQVGVPAISKASTSVKAIMVPCPRLEEQNRVVDYLKALDDKIELNRQMNETLEAMAQTLFHSWFVDFDLVIDNALAAGNSIPDELFEQVEKRKVVQKNKSQDDQGPRSLFPDEFEFTEEMGWIPRGWEVTPAYEVADFINGSSFKSQYFSDENEGLPIVKIAEIKNGISEQTKFTTQEMPEKYLINDGAILFSWSGNPDTSIDTFIWTGGKGWLNQHIFNVVLHKASDKTFVYYLLKYLKPIFTEIARDKQTTGLGHVTVKDMKRIYTIKPSDLILKAFGLHSNSIFERWYQNLCSSRELTKLRDTLLPKLMSGEIRIPDAAALVEDV